MRADGEKRAPPRRQGARFAPREPRFARVWGPACPLRRPAAASIDRSIDRWYWLVGRSRAAPTPENDPIARENAREPRTRRRRATGPATRRGGASHPAGRPAARSLAHEQDGGGVAWAASALARSLARSLRPRPRAGRRSVCRAFTRSAWLFPAEPFTSTPLPWLGPRPPPAQTGGGAAARPPHLAQEGKGASTAGGGGCGSPPSLQRGGEGRGGGRGGGGG